MKHILVAFDGSDPSNRALEHAAKMAKALKAKLTILIVRLVVVGRSRILVAPDKEEALVILDQAKDVVSAAGGPKPTIVEKKSRDIAYTIIDEAIKKKVDLIVMGASGKGTVKMFLLGSVSEEVLRKSACPVTIVH